VHAQELVIEQPLGLYYMVSIAAHHLIPLSSKFRPFV